MSIKRNQCALDFRCCVNIKEVVPTKWSITVYNDSYEVKFVDHCVATALFCRSRQMLTQIN